MTDQRLLTARPDTRPPSRGPGLVRAIRGLGWTLIGTGLLIMLYLVYLLFLTNLQTDAAQRELLDEWELAIGEVDAALPGEDLDDTTEAEAARPGDAVAAIWFERDGERIVHDDTLFVLEGTSVADLRRGPGHYEDTQLPGEVGNFAISGHRTTYGAPFYNLDQLQPGDQIHVVDRNNVLWVYELEDDWYVVAPTAIEVIGPDPLDEGGAWMTLTTCHPRLSAAQRLIVHARLLTELPVDEEPEPEATEEPVVELPDVGAADRDVPAISLTGPVAVLIFLATALLVFVVSSRLFFRGRERWWLWSGIASAGSMVLLSVLFTSVFPWIERAISSPTLGT